MFEMVFPGLVPGSRRRQVRAWFAIRAATWMRAAHGGGAGTSEPGRRDLGGGPGQVDHLTFHETRDNFPERHGNSCRPSALR